MTKTALGFAEDPRRLGDGYRYQVRSNGYAAAARQGGVQRQIPYSRGNGDQFGRLEQPPSNFLLGEQMPRGTTEQGRLLRPAMSRNERTYAYENKAALDPYLGGEVRY